MKYEILIMWNINTQIKAEGTEISKMCNFSFKVTIEKATGWVNSMWRYSVCVFTSMHISFGSSSSALWKQGQNVHRSEQGKRRIHKSTIKQREKDI